MSNCSLLLYQICHDITDRTTHLTTAPSFDAPERTLLLSTQHDSSESERVLSRCTYKLKDNHAGTNDDVARSNDVYVQTRRWQGAQAEVKLSSKIFNWWYHQASSHSWHTCMQTTKNRVYFLLKGTPKEAEETCPRENNRGLRPPIRRTLARSCSPKRNDLIQREPFLTYANFHL